MNHKILLAVFAASLMAFSPLMASVGFDSSGTDWTHAVDSTNSMWISNDQTPKLEGESINIRPIWSDYGKSDAMGGSWDVASTPVAVGENTYYVDRNDGKNVLKKVETATGRLLASQEYASDSMYNVHIAYGEDKIFAFAKTATSIRIMSFNASDLTPTGASFDPMSGGDATQTYLSYVEYNSNGYLMYGTYTGGFACFDADGGAPIWMQSANGFYNQIPVIKDGYCIFADNGYTDGRISRGSYVYVHSIDSTASYGHMLLDDYHVLSSMTYYEGRLYLACSNTALTDLKVYSYTVTVSGDTASFDNEKSWTYGGGGSKIGNQAGVVIVDDRIYLGGGGDTQGTDTCVSVININGDDTMSTAYYIPVKEKGTIAVSTGYDDARYLYFIPYIVNGLYVAKDTPGQTNPDYGFVDIKTDIKVDEPDFSFQAVTITPGGYLIVRCDKALLCYGASLKDDGGNIITPGDVGGMDGYDVSDGAFSFLDVLFMAQVNGGLREKGANYDIFGDVNNDGSFNFLDVLFAAQVNGGIRKHLCPSVP